MKTIIYIIAVIILVGAIIIGSCKKETNTNKPDIVLYKITGLAQKGPYMNGGTITMNELDNSFKNKGTYSTVTTDNKGSFALNNVKLSSQSLEFIVTGYYFNEITGDYSDDKLTLNALVDTTHISSVNVNLLTHIEEGRVEYLINQGKSFAAAKDNAQKEILAIFGFVEKIMDHSEKLDISVNKDEDAILLAISIILQGYRNVADLNKILNLIISDIKMDGILNSDSIKSVLYDAAQSLDLVSIRKNLKNHYKELGITDSIPNFEQYINNYHTSQKLYNTTPTLTTDSITAITKTTAACGGNITSDGGYSVTARGVCWATSSNPTIGYSKTSDGSGKGSFVSYLTGLTVGTTYYVRAYASNDNGTAYGNEVNFKTISADLPIITTDYVSTITQTTATCDGTITYDGGTTEVVCGVCWATTTNPTIENNKITHNQYLGSFECNLTGLLTNTTYYVRAFATNSAGTAYGKSIAFTTLIIPPIIFNPSITYGSMTDQEGNIYKTVTIGTQTWMAENLHTTKYNNGTAIPNVTVDSIWSSHTSPAYCWYNNDAGYKVIYGALYNWYTVKTGKLCPSGWHVSTDAEWTTLTTYLGGESVAGDKLKEIGTTHWSSTFEGNEGATNESGFTALPGDMRDSYFNGTPGGIGYWWSSSIEGNYRQIWWDDSHIMSKEYMDYAGMSVRCLRDN